MLSRSNSNTADQLRRAKSVSSAHTSSSGYQRGSTIADPLVNRQQAEAAASEAFRRAQLSEHVTQSVHHQKAGHNHRRKSHTRGKSEGSHLEEARLGRRKSAKTRDGAAKPPKNARHREDSNATAGIDKDFTITRRRSVIPVLGSADDQEPNSSSLPPTSMPWRVRSSLAGDGSPTTRQTSRSTYPSDVMEATHGQSRSCVAALSDDVHFSARGNGPSGHRRGISPRIPIRELQTDDEIMAAARDRCLQDFARKQICKRKSFFGTIQKLQTRGSNMQSAKFSALDHTIPPFNYADDIAAAPLPPAVNLVSESLPSAKQTGGVKARLFSGSVKDRFKRLLRKTTPNPSGLPPQHIQATHLHQSVIGSDYASSGLSKSHDPFWEDDGLPAVVTLCVPAIVQSESVKGKADNGEHDTATNSRVTSWTNSTVAGTASGLDTSDVIDNADQQGGTSQYDASSRKLYKKSSFLGRSFQKGLRRSSRMQLQGSEEGQGLYMALQGLITSTDQSGKGDGSCSSGYRPPSAQESALGILPSQQRSESALSSSSLRAAPTIRTVTPEPEACHIRAMSPVMEIGSPPSDKRHVCQDDTVGIKSGSQQLRIMTGRSSEVSVPQAQQLVRRAQRSQQRWQSALGSLDDGKLNAQPNRSMDHGFKHAVIPDATGLPYHAKVKEHMSPPPAQVLSPSVYSRATDGTSPRAASPQDPVSTMITITGHEVRRYSLSPSKASKQMSRSRPVQGSREWREWLSDELREFSDPHDEEHLALEHHAVASNGVPTSSEFVDTPKGIQRHIAESTTSPIEATVKPARKSRPRASSRRRSSFMNERYPIIESSRSSSRHSGQSLGNKHHISATASATARSREMSASTREENDQAASEKDVDGGRHKTIGELVSGLRSKSALGLHDGRANLSEAALDTQSKQHEETARAHRTAHKARSALDIRANIKSCITATSRPVEIRRKPPTNHDMLMLDDTSRDISAGPYGNESKEEDNTNEHGDTLPALSSSEWLAGPVSKKRSAHVSPPASRGSPYPPEGSPGQRLVTGWLESRHPKSVERPPAFL